MANKRIYLAGKIRKGDWRNTIVNGERWPATNRYTLKDDLLDTSGITAWLPCGGNSFLAAWPVLPGAVLGVFDYVGPYFVGCDHGCFHGEDSHGNIQTWHSDPQSWLDLTNGDAPEDETDPHSKFNNLLFRRLYIQQSCIKALKIADVVFAWIDSPDAYGTFAELGYAAALGKEILIAGPREFSDMWFIYALAGDGFRLAESPLAALQMFITERKYIARPQFDSPIEEMFWDAWQRAGGAVNTIELEYQYSIPGTKYRVDFANLEEKVVIELDGYEYHNGKEQFTNDRQRHREIEKLGWRIIRFSGSEVYKNPDKCLKEATAFVTDLWYRRVVAADSK
jgi:very-short-patch-repair endonuclease